MFKINKNKLLAYRLVIIFLVIVLVTFLTSSDVNTHFTIIGIAAILMILAIGRLRENSKKLIFFTLFISAFFLLVAPFAIKHFSLLLILALIPYYKIKKIKYLNFLTYKNIQDDLEAKQKSLARRYERVKITTKNLEEEITRYSRLYDVSKEIANIDTSEELAEKTLESLNLKINIDRIAFYKLSRPGYKIFKLRNINEKVANSWLEYVNDINNSPDGELFKFHLKAGKKNLGLIICTGKLSSRQVKEAEILINRFHLDMKKLFSTNRSKNYQDRTASQVYISGNIFLQG